MTDNLNISLLPWQEECWKEAHLFGTGKDCPDDKQRFQVIAAGRRCGKSEYAAYRLLVAALMAPPQAKTWYVAPTQGQAKDALWEKLMDLGHSVIKSSHINNLEITLINDRKITLKGADRPDTLRGTFLSLLVLDEYADMKPQVWDEILRPSLSDLKAPAVFIGTPKGRNHFYDLYVAAEEEVEEDDDNWKAYHFTSYDNPMLDPREIDRAQRKMSRFAFNQEFMASFAARESEIFKLDDIIYSTDEPSGGDYLITADLAGFAQTDGKKKQRRDNSVFAVVKVGDFQDEHGPYNWWVKELIIGRWSVTETANKMFNLIETLHPRAVGIEKGIAQQAVMDPLEAMMRRRNRFFRVEPLTHGNQNKTNRIIWALESRLEKKQIRFNKGDWNKQFEDELLQFPDKLTHDDCPDALSYISQLDETTYHEVFEQDYWEPLDEEIGY